MPVKDLREAISVDVVDLSEVIRLDVEDADPDRAVELNAAVLARYRTIAEISDRRADDSVAIDRRTEVIAELEIADKLALDISASQLRDVDLELREESITRQLASAVDRADRLASRADDQLVEVTPVDDRPELQRQLASAREISSSLEGDLLALRSEEVTIERAIEQQVNTEVPFVDPLKEQRLVELRLQADSVQREVDTLAQRIVTLNRLIAESRLDQPAQASSGSIDDELTAANTLVLDLEADLLAVRTERATLGQETATLPSVQRRIDRLEQQLASLDSEIDVAATRAAGPSPIEVLTPPLLLEEPVGNPRLRSAALGFLASLPIALAVGALVRRRQRKQF